VPVSFWFECDEVMLRLCSQQNALKDHNCYAWNPFNIIYPMRHHEIWNKSFFCWSSENTNHLKFLISLYFSCSFLLWKFYTSYFWRNKEWFLMLKNWFFFLSNGIMTKNSPLNMNKWKISFPTLTNNISTN
jgi:hypothetical protein